MYSPKSCLSPTYKNLRSTHNRSPKELKEKLRKDYKSKVQNCRDMLVNRFRGNAMKTDIQSTVTEIYKNLYDFSEKASVYDEESEVLEEIKNELIQEELIWWLEEYNKSDQDIDWSVLHQEDNVICPMCQKLNFELSEEKITCPNCKITIKTDKSLLDIKKIILDTVEKHGSSCTEEPQFTAVTETNDTHIYLICNTCLEMHLIL